MQFAIDLAIAFGAILAAAYCLLLSRRLRALTRLDGDVGKAIAVLSKQVDDLTIALRAAERSNTSAGTALGRQISQADATARRLELLMAAAQAGTKDPAPREASAQAFQRRAEGDSCGADGFTPLRQSTSKSESDPRRRVVRQREQEGAYR